MLFRERVSNKDTQKTLVVHYSIHQYVFSFYLSVDVTVSSYRKKYYL